MAATADPRAPPCPDPAAWRARPDLAAVFGAADFAAAAVSAAVPPRASGVPGPWRVPREFLAIFVLSEPCQVYRSFRGYLRNASASGKATLHHTIVSRQSLDPA
jgi:hypothetical protein